VTPSPIVPSVSSTVCAGGALLAGRGLTAALLALVTISCSITSPSSRSATERELSQNRQRWASSGIHEYEFDYQMSCFCPPEATKPVHITVRQDAVASVVRNEDGLAAGTSYAAWPTVLGLFADIETRLDQGVSRITVDYDPTYGYPRSIVVDVAAMAVDDEYSRTAGNLRRLP
jgi:hypothetical protein